MANIEEIGASGQQAFDAQIRGMADEELLAQDLVQQGAIHAISTLLTIGCDEDTAVQMLQSLRDNASKIRGEAIRRGKPSIFEQDQTYFQLK